MPTWAEHYAQADLKANRAAQDIVRRERHARWDLQAQDRTPKSARPHFAVVGEGSRASQEAYRRGYDAIVWRRNHSKETQDAYKAVLARIEPQRSACRHDVRASSSPASPSGTGAVAAG